MDLHDIVTFFTAEHVAAIESIRYCVPRPVDLLWPKDKADEVWAILTTSICEPITGLSFANMKTESMLWAMRRLPQDEQEMLIELLSRMCSDDLSVWSLWKPTLDFMNLLIPMLRQLHVEHVDVGCVDHHPYGRMWEVAQQLCEDPYAYLVSACVPSMKHELIDHYDDTICDEMLNAVAAVLGILGF